MNKTIYLTAQSTIKQILAFVLMVLLARYLSVEVFGKYQQLNLIIGLFGTVFTMGLPLAISYFHGQTGSYKEKVSIYKRFFLTQTLFVIFGAGIYLLVAKHIATFFNNDFFVSYSIILVIIITTSSSIELFRNLSTVTNRLKSFLFLTSSLSLLSIIVALFFLLLTKNILYILCIIAFFNALTFCCLVNMYLKYFRAKTKKKVITKNEFVYIASIGSFSFISLINGYIDQIMVSSMLSINDYSNLKIGSTQIPFISIVTGSLLTAMVPIISKHFKNNNFNAIIVLWKKSIEKATILLIPIIVFCLVFAQEIIIVFFGDKYSSATIIFQVYMLQWLRGVVIFNGVMSAIGLEKVLLRNTLILVLLNIVFNYIFIGYFGVVGAAIATTLISYIGIFMVLYDINRVLKKNFFSYFPRKLYLFSFFLSLFICVLLKIILKDTIDSFYMILCVSIIFYAIIIALQMKIFFKEISLKKVRNLI